MMIARKFRTASGRKRERMRLLVRTMLVVVGVCGIMGGVFYLLHHPAVRIHEVYVSGDGVLPADEVTAQVRGMITPSASFSLIPSDSSFFVSRSDIEDMLRSTFPRIDLVSVERTSLQALSVRITERSPEALWCGDVVPPIAYTFGASAEDGREEVWGDCYLVDHGGYVYAPAPVYTGNVLPRYYSSLQHAKPVGQYLFDTIEFERMQTLFRELNGETRMLEAVLVVDERDIELYFNKGLRVLALRSDIAETVIQRTLSLFASGTLTEGAPIEYVDMRFGNKVYVKRVQQGTAIEVPEEVSG